MVCNLELVRVGSKEDYFECKDTPNIDFCLCAKTFHKMFARPDGQYYDGYDTKSIPKTSAEYLLAYRPEQNTLAANVIDAPTIDYISEEAMSACVEFVENSLANNRFVLVVCDQGKSRSMAVVFLTLLKNGYFDLCENYDMACTLFKFQYKDASFGVGINEFCRKKYNERVLERGDCT